MNMMCQCKLINCNKYPSLVGMLINGGAYPCVGQGVYGKSLSQFCCKTENAQKIKS